MEFYVLYTLIYSIFGAILAPEMETNFGVVFYLGSNASSFSKKDNEVLEKDLIILGFMLHKEVNPIFVLAHEIGHLISGLDELEAHRTGYSLLAPYGVSEEEYWAFANRALYSYGIRFRKGRYEHVKGKMLLKERFPLNWDFIHK